MKNRVKFILSETGQTFVNSFTAFDPAYLVKCWAIILFIVWAFADHRSALTFGQRLWTSPVMFGYMDFLNFHAHHQELLGNLISLVSFIAFPFTMFLWESTLGKIERAFDIWPYFMALGMFGFFIGFSILIAKGLKWGFLVIFSPFLDILGFIEVLGIVIYHRYLKKENQEETN